MNADWLIATGCSRSSCHTVARTKAMCVVMRKHSARQYRSLSRRAGRR